MRVLVTGAAGFIGSHIASALRAGEHDVLAVDAMVDSAHGSAPDAPDDLVVADVRDLATMTRLIGEVDVVCHQAAIVGAGVDPADTPAYASHNDVGTAVVLAAMHATGCARLVLASSMVVYGAGRFECPEHGEVQPAARTAADLDAGQFDNRCPVCGAVTAWALVEEDAPLRPRGAYAASKLAQENYALGWTLATGGSATALRYHNVYGAHMPRDTPYSGVAAMFRSALAAGQAPRVYEDGAQARDFVDVRDVAAANVAAVERGLPGFTAFNVCSGSPITIGEVARVLARKSGGPEPVVTGQYRSADVRHIVASPRRASAELGFTARIGPEAGLREFATAPLRAVVSATRPHI